MTTSSPDSAPSAFERRRLQQREETRRTILDATGALLVEDGYEGFSMRRLAARCGYAAPSIYHHFGDKQSLLDAVVEERFQLVLGRRRWVRRRPDPPETVRAMMAEFVQFGLENPDHYKLLDLPRPGDPSPPPSSERVRELLHEQLEELGAAGRLASDSVDEAAQFLWCVITGLLRLQVVHSKGDWSDRLPEFGVEAALRGLVLPAAEGEVTS
ncbi:MAG: TetR/AcrR family transcriptional regulator [Myxococcota bacterium]